MQNQIMEMVASAIIGAPVVTGIVQVIKQHTKLAGIGVVLCAVLVGVALFGAVAYVFDYPMAESLLFGILTGFASIGAFEGIKKTKGG